MVPGDLKEDKVFLTLKWQRTGLIIVKEPDSEPQAADAGAAYYYMQHIIYL